MAPKHIKSLYNNLRGIVQLQQSENYKTKENIFNTIIGFKNIYLADKYKRVNKN